MLEKIQETAAYLKGKMHTSPETAIILGTGLGSLANEITEKYEISYSDIPNFPVSTVEGHSGKLIFGKLGNKDIIAMQGRFHYYEGYSMKEVTFPVRVMRELGIKTLFVSNASGGTNADFEIGDLMIITDHINYFPEHPLRGKNIPYGPRFPDMSEAYSKELIRKADEIAKEKGIKVQHGVYIGTQGPTFETPAEYKLLHILGAVDVYMSTVPEVSVASHCGIKVFGISLGVTCVLFVALAVSYAGVTVNGTVLNFLRDFGLILFVFFIGLQVGPSFFSSFKSGGLLRFHQESICPPA